MSDVSKVIAEIAEGRHDDRLSDLIVAVRLRAQAEAIAWLWKVSWDGLEITEEDITLDEMATAESVAGRNWSQLNPKMSAGNCRAILIAGLVHRRNLSESDARRKVKKLTALDAVDCVTDYEVAPAPLEGSLDGSTPDSE